jgi:hypothetical protein
MCPLVIRSVGTLFLITTATRDRVTITTAVIAMIDEATMIVTIGVVTLGTGGE